MLSLGAGTRSSVLKKKNVQNNNKKLYKKYVFLIKLVKFNKINVLIVSKFRDKRHKSYKLIKKSNLLYSKLTIYFKL